MNGYVHTGEPFLLELAGKVGAQTTDWSWLQAKYQVGEMLIGQHRMNSR